LSLIKSGVSSTEIKRTDLAPRGITGTKLKSIGTQEVEIVLGNRTYTYDFLVTALDFEYSGVFGLDLLRQMEAKVDLCPGGLIIGRRMFELAGLDCQERGLPQVTVMEPVAENVGGVSDLINPTCPQGKVKATGKQDAGKPATLIEREMNPHSPLVRKHSHNTCSIVLARQAIVPPRSRIVTMGRLSGGRQVRDLTRPIVVDPIPTNKPGVCRSFSERCVFKSRQ
jgi:hypothetical protein